MRENTLTDICKSQDLAPFFPNSANADICFGWSPQGSHFNAF
ncbi:MAG: hypothetical protein ABSB19_10160 [Methylomonas sp.]